MSLRALLNPLWCRLGRPLRTATRGLQPSNIAKESPLLLQNRGFASKKHKFILKHSKGFRGRAKNCFTIAVRKVHKAWQYAYRDRKQQKREWRKLWIQRVGAGFRQYGWSYSRAIHELPKHNIQLNRKVLSELASNEPFAFKAIVDVLEHQHQHQQQNAQQPGDTNQEKSAA
uniref:50S ribosomal protein L20 n=1 Tax=Cyclophora tenuis TaxID=216820 RepID=A0A7S1D8P3_CYCTE|mmetsp:Transcript_25162/g.42864  ORF Transcript_25162/g.42864 Transcript_25162/m.42864 type:complete len:172 (+) Transcript_25162:29-544(+)